MSIFIQNKYSTWYFNIINKAKERRWTKKTAPCYVERHHIIPKSCGGSNFKDNLVCLTAKEHFVCHHLLIKMMISKKYHQKMVVAYWFMIKTFPSRNMVISSRSYTYIRTLVGEKLKGENNPIFGQPRSIETKLKISKNRSKQFGKENSFYGKKHSEETLNKLRGPRSEDLKEKLRLSTLKRFNSHIFKITDTITNEVFTLFFSEFFRKFNLNPENARKTAKDKNHNWRHKFKYRHWLFEKLDKIILTSDEDYYLYMI